MSDEALNPPEPAACGPLPALSPLAALDRDFSWVTAQDGGASSGESADEKTAENIERLGFRIADLHLVCPFGWVSEVAPVPPIHRIPNPPQWILGAANLRGNVVPIANPARFLGLQNRPERTMLVVFGTGEDRAGLLVDDLPDIHRFTSGDRLGALPPVPEALRAHLLDAYEKQGVIWLEVDIGSLLERLNQ